METKELIDWVQSYIDENTKCFDNADLENEELVAIRDRLVAAERMAEGITLWHNESTGQFDKKSCGHSGTCVCVARKLIEALKQWEALK